MATLPLPVPPVTVYAAGSQVKSADLNLYNAFELAVKNFLEDGYFTRPLASDDSPVIAFTDRAGNERTYVDPNGYMFGPAIEEVYRWRTDDAISASSSGDLVDDSAGTTTASAQIDAQGTDVYDTNFVPLDLTVLSGVSSTKALVTRVGFGSSASPSGTSNVKNIDDAVMVLEFMAMMTAIGSNLLTISMGFHEAPGSNMDVLGDYCMLTKATSDTNWAARTADGASQTREDTGVTPAALVFETFRIEYHGVNTPIGVENSSATARYFIDGALVKEHTTDVPTEAEATKGLTWFLSIQGTSPPGDRDLTVSPVRFAYNMVLSPDVPA